MSETSKAAQLAGEYGLRQIGVRPKLATYIKDVIGRREFLYSLSAAKAQAENQNTYLGQFWTLLTPLLNSLVYILIFGIMLDTTRGMENIVAFIVLGTFMYGTFSTVVTDASKSVKANRKLVQALHFPRALLPLSAALKDLLVQLPGLFVMTVIAQVSIIVVQGSDKLQPQYWPLIIPLVFMLHMFATGFGFILARMASRMPDILKLLPFVLRIGMYASGVIFSIGVHLPEGGLLRNLLEYQPLAVFVTLARQALAAEPSIPMDYRLWLYGLLWAVVIFIVGFIVFWRDEARYGRD